jgi:hypothetical protein
MTKHIAHSFASQFSKTARGGHKPLDVIAEGIEPEPNINCPHQAYCSVKAFGTINCIIHPNSCQTHRFYEKYGMNYNQIGIGAMT